MLFFANVVVRCTITKMEDKTAGNVAAENASPITTPKRKPRKSAKGWSQRPKSNHPPTSEMVTAAIKELKDRKGSIVSASYKKVHIKHVHGRR